MCGRKAPCPCGSGKKFKRCCIEQFEEQERLDDLRVEQEQFAVANRERLDLLKAGLAKLVTPGLKGFNRLTEAVLQLIDAKQLDEAEAMARQLEAKFPDHATSIERLGQVYEARGMTPAAAAHYRRAVALMDVWGEGKYCDCCRARMVKAVWHLDPNGPALALVRDPQ